MMELIVGCFEGVHRAEQVRASLLTTDPEFETAVIARRQRDGVLMWSHWAELVFSKKNTIETDTGDRKARTVIPGNILQSLADLTPDSVDDSDLSGLNAVLAAARREGLKSMGIDDDFLQDVANRLKLEHSAMFIVLEAGAPEKFVECLRSNGAEILQKQLTYDQGRLDSINKERFSTWSENRTAQRVAGTQALDPMLSQVDVGKKSVKGNALKLVGLLVLLMFVGVVLNVGLTGFCHCAAAHKAHQICWLKMCGMVLLGGFDGWILNRWLLKGTKYFPLLCAAGALFGELSWESAAAFAIR